MNQQETISQIFSGNSDGVTHGHYIAKSESDLYSLATSLLHIIEDERASYSMTALIMLKGDVALISHDCNFDSADGIVSAIIQARQSYALRVIFDYSYPSESVNGSYSLEFISGGVFVTFSNDDLCFGESQ